MALRPEGAASGRPELAPRSGERGAAPARPPARARMIRSDGVGEREGQTVLSFDRAGQIDAVEIERAAGGVCPCVDRGNRGGRGSQGLRSLSPRERETFVLRDLEGLATPEVARILDIGESSVRSLLSLARRRLRQLYGERIAPGGQG